MKESLGIAEKHEVILSFLPVRRPSLIRSTQIFKLAKPAAGLTVSHSPFRHLDYFVVNIQSTMTSSVGLSRGAMRPMAVAMPKNGPAPVGKV